MMQTLFLALILTGPPDLSRCEAGEIAVGSHFAHDGQTWVRLAPDPDWGTVELSPFAPAPDLRSRILAARLTGPSPGVPEPMFARAWVRRVHVRVTRAKEGWEE